VASSIDCVDVTMFVVDNFVLDDASEGVDNPEVDETFDFDDVPTLVVIAAVVVVVVDDNVVVVFVVVAVVVGFVVVAAAAVVVVVVGVVVVVVVVEDESPLVVVVCKPVSSGNGCALSHSNIFKTHFSPGNIV
jgi:hypothetical protein